jgi:predicted TIM-barrel fold metal-dependent hydrolase
MASGTQAATSRRRLDHPVIDSDGHFVEFFPAFLDYFRSVAGSAAGDRFEAEWNRTHLSSNWYALSPQQRREQRAVRPPFWNIPTRNTLDLATAMLPELMHERLDEIGSDYAVIYPGLGLNAPHFHDPEVRRASCRALNLMYADLFRDLAARMTPTAVIPMHSPEEAIEELEYAVRQLGLKVIVMPSYVMRPIPAVARDYPEAWRYAFWLDTYGLDSDFDYDPVWARCQELGVVPTFHSGGMGWGSRNSISNYMYNHIGHFASAAEALCKSLFLGGVTRRFPRLRFSFLEGGVGWARSLLSDLIGHWRKRNREQLANYDPAYLDQQRLAEFFRRYGGKLLRGREHFEGAGVIRAASGTAEPPDSLDEWARCGIERVEDLVELFVPRFYFGCEADDPITSSAFDTRRNPQGARLRAIYGSDIGHWDVPDMRQVFDEICEPLDEGLISAEDFRDFVFGNPAHLWTALNPAFFRGTAVQDAVDRYLGPKS